MTLKEYGYDWRCFNKKEFANFVNEYDFKRRVSATVLEHCDRLQATSWRGQETLLDIAKDYETRGTASFRRKGIPYAVTIGKDGVIWKTADWDKPLRTEYYKNRDTSYGPFCIGLVGDFRKGYVLDERQYDSVMFVMTYMLLIAGENVYRKTAIFHKPEINEYPLPKEFNLQNLVDYANEELFDFFYCN